MNKKVMLFFGILSYSSLTYASPNELHCSKTEHTYLISIPGTYASPVFLLSPDAAQDISNADGPIGLHVIVFDMCDAKFIHGSN